MPPTKPAHGVNATNPATNPEAAPRVVAWPVRSRSTTNQPSIAAAAAMCVFTSAWAAMPSPLSADPALNPNQPNHRMPAPMSVNGSACGGIGWLGQPLRFPRMNTAARAAIPALMCTTVPPAKSSAPRLNSQPEGENTQCAIGAYTRTAQSPMNHTHAENFIRSATAPVINAGVMIANISWKAMNVRGGIDSSKPVGDVAAASRSQARARLPIHFLSPLNAREYVS